MKKNVLEAIKKGIEENLPTILTGVGVGTGLLTIGYSVYAGYKIKEVVDNDKLDKKQKRKKIFALSVPVAGGAIVSTVCSIAAGKEHAQKYAALAAMAAATKLDGEAFKEEATKILGKDKVREIEEDISSRTTAPSGPRNKRYHFVDTVTGYEFDTTLAKYIDLVTNFNQELAFEELPISRFYEDLLGDEYNFAESHEHVRFGPDTSSPLFVPEYDGWLDDNMTPGYSVSYSCYYG